MGVIYGIKYIFHRNLSKNHFPSILTNSQSACLSLKMKKSESRTKLNLSCTLCEMHLLATRSKLQDQLSISCLGTILVSEPGYFVVLLISLEIRQAFAQGVSDHEKMN